jgi:general secretion pathway protein B
MSFILDALKKLEQEKAARKKETVNVSDEILRGSHQGRRKAKRTVPVSVVLVGLGLLLLLGAAGVLFWHWHAADEPQAVALRLEPTVPPAARMPEEVQPAPVAEPAVAPVRTPEPVAVEPAAPVRVSESMAVGAAAPVGMPERMATRPDRSARETPNRRQTRHASPQRPAQVPSQIPAQADSRDQSVRPYREVPGSGGSGLTVSGIAWQEKPAARRAVINGTLLEEGATVNGATVEEILPTKVRFSSGGRQFTVSISSPMTGR